MKERETISSYLISMIKLILCSFGMLSKLLVIVSFLINQYTIIVLNLLLFSIFYNVALSVMNDS